MLSFKPLLQEKVLKQGKEFPEKMDDWMMHTPITGFSLDTIQ